MFITKLFLATLAVVALSAQAVVSEPKASYNDAKSIIKKADRDLGPQIDEAMSRYRDGASKFDLLAANLEKSWGCLNSVTEGPYAKMTVTQQTTVTTCRISIRKAQEDFMIHQLAIRRAEREVNSGTIKLIDLLLSGNLNDDELVAIRGYSKYLREETKNNFGERFQALTDKTQEMLDQLK